MKLETLIVAIFTLIAVWLLPAPAMADTPNNKITHELARHPVDKVVHATGSFIVASLLVKAGMKPWAAATAVFALGVAKEYLFDKEPDAGDISADAFGSFLVVPVFSGEF